MKTEQWFCDGCDRQLQPAEVNVRWTVVSTTGFDSSTSSAFQGPFDLCLSCVDRVEEKANPKRWGRVAQT